jgi:polygalacturonase
VRNVAVKNCTFEGTENGLRIKSPRGRGGLVEDITYSDIVMKDVRPNAITITCYYPKIPQIDAAQPVTSETPIFRNIKITNIKATAQKSAGVIIGLPESLVENVVLENIQISAPAGLTIRNAKAVKLNNVKIETQGDRQPFILENAQVEGLEQTNK